jgi:hypothetical protein
MFFYATAFNHPLVSWNVASISQKQKVFDLAVAYRQPETMEMWRAAGYSDSLPSAVATSAFRGLALVDYQVASVTRTTAIPRLDLSGGQATRQLETAARPQA